MIESGSRRHRASHDRLAAADQCRLLARDRRQRPAEPLAVLVVDVGDDRHRLLVEDVAVVGAAAEARPPRPRAVAIAIGEMLHAGGECHFDERRPAEADAVEHIEMHLAHQRVEPEHRVRELVGRDQLAVDIDALDERLQVRRRVEPGAQSSGAQDRGHDRRRRSLARAPGHVHTGNLSADRRNAPAASRCAPAAPARRARSASSCQSRRCR